MPTNYPGGLDNWTNPTANTSMDAVGFEHDILHSNAIDALEAIEAELGTDPKGNLATIKARLELLHSAAGYLNFVTGGWYGSHWTTSGTSNQTLVANRLYILPMWVPRSVTFDRIGVNVATGVADATVRIGIYSSSASFLPNALVRDAGTVDVSTTGAKEIVINETLTTGVWWLASVSGAGPVLTATNAGAQRPLRGQTTLNVSAPFVGYSNDSAAHISGLPNPFPALSNASQAPHLLLRVA